MIGSIISNNQIILKHPVDSRLLNYDPMARLTAEKYLDDIRKLRADLE